MKKIVVRTFVLTKLKRKGTNKRDNGLDINNPYF